MRPQHPPLISIPQTYQRSMTDTLIMLANIPSGSYNLEGLATVRLALQQLYASIADEIIVHELPAILTHNLQGTQQQSPSAPALIIRKRPHCKKRMLLTGHMDTVYGPDHPMTACHYVQDTILKGPGVSDMKGGLVVMHAALTAFEQLAHAHQLGWDVIINADEELGSPASSTLWATLPRDYIAAFVYEPASDPDGTFAKNRPGSAKITLTARGKSAHAGRDFHAGRNAITYLADIILALHALNGKRSGLVVNVGMIAGGEAINQVPACAVAKVDVRMKNNSDHLWFTKSLQHIQKQFIRQEYQLAIDAFYSRPVKKVSPQTCALFSLLQRIAKTSGQKIRWRDTGGCCDGNQLNALGHPVIDTMGVIGGKIHTSEEWIDLDSLLTRSTLSLNIFNALAQQDNL